MNMKISEIISFSFREELARIRQQEALRASHHLILYPTPHGNLVSRHLSTQSQFCRACVSMGYLSPQQMQHAALRYQLGMSRDGGVIFWQINQLGQVYDGKIMYYRPDCHRDHEHVPTWVISVIKSFYQCPVDIPTPHCLFGSHLLKPLPDSPRLGEEHQTVCVVESEKTAVILSEVFPQYLWLAAGGLNELTVNKLFPLRHRQVIIFPDTDETQATYSLWFRIAQDAMRCNGGKITVSPLLEQKATAEQKSRKIDLVDFLFESHRVTGHKV